MGPGARAGRDADTGRGAVVTPGSSLGEAIVVRARDQRARRALLVVGTLPAGYALLVLATAFLSRISTDQAPGLSAANFPALLADMLSLACYGLLVAVIAWLVGAIARAVRRKGESRPVRVSRIVMLCAFVLPYALASVEFSARYVLMLGVCLPGTALALWGFHRVQRYRRMPLWLLFSAFGWGFVIAPGYAVSVEFWSVTAVGHAMSSAQTAVQVVDEGHLATMVLLLSAAFFEEMVKLVGVAVLFVLFGRYLDGIVSGVVLGAVTGLGLNLAESFVNMAESPGGAASQYWLRQCVGVLGAHTAFAAIAGAGIGLAQQLRDPGARFRAVACGLATAVCGHFATDAVLTAQAGWHVGGQRVVVLVVLPAVMIAVDGPLVAMYVLLLRAGLRAQSRGLAAVLGDEVSSGFGAVTVTEATTLLNPRLRLWSRVTALRYGFVAWRELGRLQAVQADLAMRQWRRSSGSPPAREPGDDSDLRARISELRSRQVVAFSGVSREPAA